MRMKKINQESGRPPRLQAWILLPFVIVVTGSMIACEKKNVKDGSANEDSILAVVGQDRITNLDLNADLETIENGKNIYHPNQSKAREQALEALVDREILKQAAIREKIDLDPMVQQAVEREKEKILAQAYLQTKIMQTKKPTQQEIDEYYRLHNIVYTKRKLLRIEKIAPDSNMAQSLVKNMADGGKSLEQIMAWLDNHKFTYSRTQFEVSSDALPTGFSEKLGSLASGGLFIVNDDGQFQLCSMTILRNSPETEDEAAAQIEQILSDQKTRQVIVNEIARLRSVAKIEYHARSDELPDLTRLTELPTPAQRNGEIENTAPAKDVRNVTTPIN